MNRLHNLPALAFTFLALILLSACFGGGSQSCDAEFCGTSTPRTAAAPVTPPTMTPDNGNGGGPGTGGGMTPDPMTPGNGGGMPPDPMPPIMLPTPALTSLFTTGSTTSGGVARVIDTQVNRKDAVLLIIAEANINALLQAPLTTQLLDSTGAAINYAATPRPTLQTATTGTPVTISRGGITITKGNLYTNPLDSNNMRSFSNVYIDNSAPVVLNYEAPTGANRGTTSLEFTMIGEPLSRMPTTTDVFSGTYSGFAAVTRKSGVSILYDSGTFDMNVGFSNGMSTITNFEADFGEDGSVTASSININTNGDFTGTANITAGTKFLPAIDSSDTSGSFYGQFHGLDAAGVTGVFHNSANTVLGGFAGSKE